MHPLCGPSGRGGYDAAVNTGRVFRRSSVADPPVAVEAHGLDDPRRDRPRVPRRRGRRHRRQHRSRPARRSPQVMAEQAGRLAYAHGSAFTTEPLEAYAREVARHLPGRRSGDLPGVGRLGGDRDGAQAGPGLPHRPRRARPLDRLSPGGGATTATRSAPSTCPAASRSAGRTRAGSAASATSPRPIRTAPASPAPNALGHAPTSSPPSSTRRFEAAEPGHRRRLRRRADRRGDAGRRRPARRLLAGRSPRSAAGTASCSSPTR